MLEPLKQWYCDTCGGIIKSPQDGLVEWLEEGFHDEPYSSYGFKIIHAKMNCFFYPQDDDRLRDMNLENFLGDEGYIYLLSFLDLGPEIPIEYKGPRVRDIREFVIFMKRLTVPYFEEARKYISRAIQEENLDPSQIIGIFNPKELKRLIKIYGS